MPPLTSPCVSPASPVPVPVLPRLPPPAPASPEEWGCLGSGFECVPGPARIRWPPTRGCAECTLCPQAGTARGGLCACVCVCVCQCAGAGRGLQGRGAVGPPSLVLLQPLAPAPTAPVPSPHPLCPHLGSTGSRPLAAPSHSAKPCPGWGAWAALRAPLCHGAPCEALEDGRSGMGELHLGMVGMWGP